MGEPVNGCLPFPNTCDWCGDAGELQRAPDGGEERLCGRCAATFPVACPWTDPDECAMAHERSVAGVADVIPSCAVHGRTESEAT